MTLRKIYIKRGITEIYFLDDCVVSLYEPTMAQPAEFSVSLEPFSVSLQYGYLN